MYIVNISASQEYSGEKRNFSGTAHSYAGDLTNLLKELFKTLRLVQIRIRCGPTRHSRCGRPKACREVRYIFQRNTS